MTRRGCLRLKLGLAAALLPATASRAPADDAGAADKDGPAVRLVLPLGVVPGQKTRLTLRGRKLDRASEVRLSPPVAPVAIIERGKAAKVNGTDADAIGDTQVIVELTLPPEPPRDPLALVVVAPGGASGLFPVAIDRQAPVAEREPNGGFREAQPVASGGTVAGTIGQAQDVDVFRLEGGAGSRLTLDVSSPRLGSPLDPWLNLYDGRGRLLTPTAGTAGAGRSEWVLPAAGSYYAVLMDAFDRGSPLHAYRLTVHSQSEAESGAPPRPGP